MSAAREKRVIDLVMSGYTSTEISREIGISQTRVEKIIDEKGRTQTELSNRLRKGDETDIDDLSDRLQTFITNTEASLSDLKNLINGLDSDKLDKKFSIHTPKGSSETVPSISDGEMNQYTKQYTDSGFKITEHLIRDHKDRDYVVLSFKEST